MKREKLWRKPWFLSLSRHSKEIFLRKVIISSTSGHDRGTSLCLGSLMLPYRAEYFRWQKVPDLHGEQNYRVNELDCYSSRPSYQSAPEKVSEFHENVLHPRVPRWTPRFRRRSRCCNCDDVGYLQLETQAEIALQLG